jgi:hypothetical protein
MEGVKPEQTLRLAKKLGFSNSLLAQVSSRPMIQSDTDAYIDTAGFTSPQLG